MFKVTNQNIRRPCTWVNPIVPRLPDQIEILLQEKKQPREIAKALGKDIATIEREIIRGTVRMLAYDLTYVDKYCADAAQRIYLEKAANKSALKIGHDHEPGTG